MATKKRKGRKKRKSLLHRMSRAVVRRTERRLKARWGKVKKTFEPKVVKNHKRDAWKVGFPDPKRPAPLTMVQVDPEDYEATFDGSVVVAFTAWPPYGDLDVVAREAAEQQHGPIAQTWHLDDVEPMNDAARAALPEGTRR